MQLTDEMKAQIQELVKSTLDSVVPTQVEEPKAEEPAEKIVKSLEDAKEAGIINDDEFGIIQAWRANEIKVEDEPVNKSNPADQADLLKSIQSTISAELEPMKKALSDKDELIKSMKAEIESLKTTPSYDKKSVSAEDVIEKGAETKKEAGETLRKSFSRDEILDGLEELQKSNAASTRDIAEYEMTNNLSNVAVKTALFKHLQSK